MIRDSEFDDDAINKLLHADSLNRNTLLNNLIATLNSVNKNFYLSIDGDWGTGKSVFVHGLEYLNYYGMKDEAIPKLSNTYITEFQDKYEVFYYNAWENDYHSDPLSSLLLSMVDAFYTEGKRRDKIIQVAGATVDVALTGAIKLLTANILDIDKIKTATKIEELTASINTANERRLAVHEIIDTVIPANKKILFIIDELDRCNPEFAVRLLEVIKHYCNTDKAVFISSTNNRELIHTVRKYYGSGFNAASYLDKLYDLMIELPEVDIEQYYRKVLELKDNSYWIDNTPVHISRYLKMSMREINRYDSLLRLVVNRLNEPVRVGSGQLPSAIVNFVIIPLALALRVKDHERYINFLDGNGRKELENLYLSDAYFDDTGSTSSASALDNAYSLYDRLRARDLNKDQTNYYKDQAINRFWSIIPIISAVVNVDASQAVEE